MIEDNSGTLRDGNGKPIGSPSDRNEWERKAMSEMTSAKLPPTIANRIREVAEHLEPFTQQNLGPDELWNRLWGKLCGIANDVEAAESESARLKARLVEVEKDAARLDWMCLQVVEVRTPMVYGSRAKFLVSPENVEGVGDQPSNLREAIDSARGA